MKTRNFLWLVTLSLLGYVQCGCGVGLEQTIGQLGRHHESYDLAGERVELRMLSDAQIHALKQTDGIDVDLTYIDAHGGSPHAGLIDIGLPELVKMGYQVVEQQVKNEAARYQQQFAASAFAPDFWADGSTMAYRGFILTRKTSADPAKPAFVLVCGFLPVDKGTFVEVLPLYLSVDRPKAKMAGDFDILKVAIAVKSQWSDEKGLHDDTLSTLTWNLSGGYDLRRNFEKFNVVTTTQPAEHVDDVAFVGAFASPPRNRAPDAKGKTVYDQSGGLPTFTVTVDEKDATEAQDLTKLVETVIESTDKSGSKATSQKSAS